MPKASKRTPQKRMGKHEAAKFGALLALAKRFKIFRDQKNLGEVKLNNLFISLARQHGIAVVNKGIHSVTFVGDTFRPECYLPGSGKIPLCAVECKKLNDSSAKPRWKEGLSQSLIYKHSYKAVIYLLYDFTESAKYVTAFGRGNRSESQFTKRLREHHKIHIIAVKPE